MEDLYEERAVELCVQQLQDRWLGGYSSHGIDFSMISAIFSLDTGEFIQRVCNRSKEKYQFVPFGLDIN